MSREAVSMALRAVHRRTQQTDIGAFGGASDKKILCDRINLWCSILNCEGIDEFVTYVQETLSSHMDSSIFILEELYAELGMSVEKTMWDDFEEFLRKED